MKHINLTSWRGSITDWTKLNYIKGGLPDYYADIANIKGNYVYIENGVYKIEQNYNAKSINDLNVSTTSYDRFTTEEISDMVSGAAARTLNVSCPGYTTIKNAEPFSQDWDLVIYNASSDANQKILITNKQYATVEAFNEAEGNKLVTYPLATPQTIVIPDFSGYKHIRFRDITTWSYHTDGGRKMFASLGQPADATRPVDNLVPADFIVPGYNNKAANNVWAVPNTDKDFAFNNIGNITFADFRYTTVEDMLAGIGNWDIYYK